MVAVVEGLTLPFGVCGHCFSWGKNCPFSLVLPFLGCGCGGGVDRVVVVGFGDVGGGGDGGDGVVVV